MTLLYNKEASFKSHGISFTKGNEYILYDEIAISLLSTFPSFFTDVTVYPTKEVSDDKQVETTKAKPKAKK